MSYYHIPTFVVHMNCEIKIHNSFTLPWMNEMNRWNKQEKIGTIAFAILYLNQFQLSFLDLLELIIWWYNFWMFNSLWKVLLCHQFLITESYHSVENNIFSDLIFSVSSHNWSLNFLFNKIWNIEFLNNNFFVL